VAAFSEALGDVLGSPADGAHSCHFGGYFLEENWESCSSGFEMILKSHHAEGKVYEDRFCATRFGAVSDSSAGIRGPTHRLIYHAIMRQIRGNYPPRARFHFIGDKRASRPLWAAGERFQSRFLVGLPLY